MAWRQQVLYCEQTESDMRAEQAERRSNSRSNVFLAATLEAGSARVPVRIRNLAPNGALIEGTPLPPYGAKIRLIRADLAADGEIAWLSDTFAGVNFHETIDVARWARRPPNPGQERVDAVVSALRRNRELPPTAAESPGRQPLKSIAAALDRCVEQLAAMEQMPIEFGEQLMVLESIAHSLRMHVSGK
jgi:hypothetical protein